jgi:hypothetical protein
MRCVKQPGWCHSSDRLLESKLCSLNICDEKSSCAELLCFVRLQASISHVALHCWDSVALCDTATAETLWHCATLLLLRLCGTVRHCYCWDFVALCDTATAETLWHCATLLLLRLCGTVRHCYCWDSVALYDTATAETLWHCATLLLPLPVIIVCLKNHVGHYFWLQVTFTRRYWKLLKFWS